MQPRDVYKLLFQAALGIEHLISSPEIFSTGLQDELAHLTFGGNDPLVEPVRPDAALVRVNLRPYKARGGVFAALRDACLQTALHSWGTEALLLEAWDTFRKAGERQAWRRWPGLAPEKVAQFHARLIRLKFPAVHHSEGYRQAYCPAYRLVSATELEGLFKG